MRRLLVLVVLLSTGALGLGNRDLAVVEVRARVLAASGWPHGGSFALLSEPGMDTMYSGRLDNLGELQVSLPLPSTVTGLVLVLDSKGMIRNTRDDIERDKTGVARATGACEETKEWYSFRWDPVGVKRPQELIRRLGTSHSVTLVGDRGETAIDSVAVRRGREDSGIMDFGEVRFPSASAGMEVVIGLTGLDGLPLADSLYLTGFIGRAQTPNGNRVYPHMSLSQRGNEVRILLSRAAWRLLCADVDGFIQLARYDDPTMHPCSVRFPSDVREAIAAGRQNRVKFSFALSPDKKETMRDLVPMPTDPKFWWLGEPSFRW